MEILHDASDWNAKKNSFALRNDAKTSLAVEVIAKKSRFNTRTSRGLLVQGSQLIFFLFL